MKAATRSRAFAPIFHVAVFGLALVASPWVVSPASAQKQGGSITVGLELDIPGFDPLKVGVYRYGGENRGCVDFRHAHHARRQGRGAAEARAVLEFLGGFQDLDLQAAARRQIPRRHAVQCRSGQGEFRPAEGSGQQVPLRLLHRRYQGRAGAGRTDRGLQSERSVGKLPGDHHHSKLELGDAVADGVEDQGRRIQPQSRRHRSVYIEVMGRGRSHGARTQSGLLEQGASLSRSPRAEAAAGCAVALRQPAIGRSGYHLGR